MRSPASDYVFDIEDVEYAGQSGKEALKRLNQSGVTFVVKSEHQSGPDARKVDRSLPQRIPWTFSCGHCVMRQKGALS